MGSAVLVFGAVLTSVSAVAGSVVCAAAALWETYVFWRVGRT